MKTFLIAVFDNDYNALIERYTVNAEDKETVQSWCQEQSWSGHSYMVEDEYDFLIKNPQKTLDK